MGAHRTAPARIAARGIGVRGRANVNHVVQHYASSAYLLDAAGEQIAESLAAGAAVVVIATRAHRETLRRSLASRRRNVAAARKRGQYIELDAASFLKKVMLRGEPAQARFENVVAAMLERVAARYCDVRVFGETAGMLRAEGDFDAALRLEAMWHALTETHEFIRCRIYPLNAAAVGTLRVPFSVQAAPRPDARARSGMLAELKQKLQRLEAEAVAHRKTAEMLQRREREFASLLDNAHECMHEVGPDGRISWANRVELESLGYAPAEYIGHHITEFYAERPASDALLEKLATGEPLHDYPARLVRRDGSLKSVVIRARARPADAGGYRLMCFSRAVRADVYSAEDRRRKDEFLAMLGHELRNPLSPILSALAVLRSDGADAEATRAAHAAIGEQTRHLSGLIDRLLDASHLNSGEIFLRRNVVDVSDAVGAAVEETRELIAAKRHRLSIALPPAGTLRVIGDGMRLRQIFVNLIENAARHMECDGQLWVRAGIDGDRIEVTVEDRGCGIKPEFLHRVFDLFSQAERTLDRAQGGLGIGLWMVRALVELHRGKVTVASPGPGQGSSFTVNLPVAPPPVDASDEAQNKQTRSTRASRILVVDDNRDGADLLALLLRMNGHVVQAVNDGISALEVAPTFDPDIVLLDIGLPGLDGYAVARRLREMGGRRRFLIAMTGYGSDDDRQRTREAGFDHHVVKPVEPAELNELVARSVEELGI